MLLLSQHSNHRIVCMKYVNEKDICDHVRSHTLMCAWCKAILTNYTISVYKKKLFQLLVTLGLTNVFLQSAYIWIYCCELVGTYGKLVFLQNSEQHASPWHSCILPNPVREYLVYKIGCACLFPANCSFSLFFLTAKYPLQFLIDFRCVCVLFSCHSFVLFYSDNL